MMLMLNFTGEFKVWVEEGQFSRKVQGHVYCMCGNNDFRVCRP